MHLRSVTRASTLAVGLFFALASLAVARPGALDPAFGAGGTVVTTLGILPSTALVQPDGGILVAGLLGDNLGRVELARFTAKGSLDTHFGSGGVVTVGLADVKSITLQSDGKIVVAGLSPSESDAELVRLLPSGAPDTTFGTGGDVVFDYVPNSSNEALVVVQQPDGKLVAGGFGLAPMSDRYLSSLARLFPNGSLDSSFGTNGTVAIALVGGITALGLQSDGKYLVCGGFVSPVQNLVARFLANGNLDRNDAGGSLVRVARTGATTFGGANAFQLDGKLLQWSTTTSRNGKRRYVRVQRLLRAGALDPTFRSPRFAFGTTVENLPNDIIVAGDGKLLVGGAGSMDPSQTVFGLARLMPAGGLDTGFGRNGTVVTAFAGVAESTALALQPDGKIVSAGISSQGSASALVLARYLGP